MLRDGERTLYYCAEESELKVEDFAEVCVWFDVAGDTHIGIAKARTEPDDDDGSFAASHVGGDRFAIETDEWCPA